MPVTEKFWTGKVPNHDDFGSAIGGVFIDGATIHGPWAIMNTISHKVHGRGLGTGLGQRYEYQEGGRWLKTGG